MKKIIKKVCYAGITFLVGYICWNYSDFIADELNWYQWGEKVINAVSFFATMGGFYLSVKAISKAIEIEESLFQKKINLGFASTYKRWLQEYEKDKDDKKFHSNILDDIETTVTQHMDHVGPFKRKKLKSELKRLKKYTKRAEKKKRDINTIIENSLKAFFQISIIFNDGE